MLLLSVEKRCWPLKVSFVKLLIFPNTKTIFGFAAGTVAASFIPILWVTKV